MNEVTCASSTRPRIEDASSPLIATREHASRLLTIDVIKAFCIIAVIITHVGDIPAAVKAATLRPFTIVPAVPMFILCSIFVFCLAEDKKQGTILSWFSTKQFFKRAGRFLVPFFISILIIILGLHVFRDLQRISAKSLFKMIMLGGRGPGAYYSLIVFQLLIIFPFLRHAYNKNQMGTVVSLVLLHIAYETWCKSVGLSATLYDRLIFRFFTQIALGFLLYSYHEKLRKTALPAICIIIGAIYLINIAYLGYDQVLLYGQPSRSIIAVLYSFGVLCYVLRLETVFQRLYKTKAGHYFLSVLLYIGKASYHIMLTQMVYFYFMRLMDWEALLGGWINALVVDLAVTLPAGCLFFAVETLARKWIAKGYQFITNKKEVIT